MDEMVKYLRALVYLQSQVVARTEGAVKPEVLLGWAGMSHKEIAGILGKPQTAVSKAISRAKSTKKDEDNE